MSAVSSNGSRSSAGYGEAVEFIEDAVRCTTLRRRPQQVSAWPVLADDLLCQGRAEQSPDPRSAEYRTDHRQVLLARPVATALALSMAIVRQAPVSNYSSPRNLLMCTLWGETVCSD